MLLPLAFIWFDVALTLLRRVILKRRLTEAHRDHLYQLLNRSGWSHSQVSGLYFLGAAVLGVLSIWCSRGFLSLLQVLIVYGTLQLALVLFVFSKKIREPHTSF
jgi:UDP-N-acetylmuramyl pentapeptide phosphotransferase/UDP-N-acetylglucosamine-1-phosphate transferase